MIEVLFDFVLFFSFHVILILFLLSILSTVYNLLMRFSPILGGLPLLNSKASTIEPCQPNHIQLSFQGLALTPRMLANINAKTGTNFLLTLNWQSVWSPLNPRVGGEIGM